MDINLTAKEARITKRGYNELSVSLEDVSIQEIIDEVGIGNLLNKIGEQEVIKHFGIIETD